MRERLEQHSRILAGSRPLRPMSPLRGSFYASQTQGLRPGLIYVAATRLPLGAFGIFTPNLEQEDPGAPGGKTEKSCVAKDWEGERIGKGKRWEGGRIERFRMEGLRGLEVLGKDQGYINEENP